MKLKLLAVLMLCVLWSAVSAQEVAREVAAEAALDVTSDGQVARAQMLTPIPEVLAKPASEVMTRWRFKPVRRHGRDVPAKTYARVKIQLLKAGADKYRIRVVYLTNGPRIQPTVTPYYPIAETGHGEAHLLLQAIVQSDGSLSDVEVVEAHTSGGPLGRLFRQSAIAALRRWHADPEVVDGRPIATHIRVPMSFCLAKTGACSKSLPKLKLWHPPATGADALPARSGQAIAMDSPLTPSAVTPDG